MCEEIPKTPETPRKYQDEIDHMSHQLKQCEIMALKMKSMKFENFQSFDFVFENYEEGEVYAIENVGYSVITKKTITEVFFVVIMGVNNIWADHFQDVHKDLLIKQGVYMDLFTGKQYKKEVHVPAYNMSKFQAVGDQDLIIKGRVYK